MDQDQADLGLRCLSMRLQTFQQTKKNRRHLLCLALKGLTHTTHDVFITEPVNMFL